MKTSMFLVKSLLTLFSFSVQAAPAPSVEITNSTDMVNCDGTEFSTQAVEDAYGDNVYAVQNGIHYGGVNGYPKKYIANRGYPLGACHVQTQDFFFEFPALANGQAWQGTTRPGRFRSVVGKNKDGSFTNCLLVYHPEGDNRLFPCG